MAEKKRRFAVLTGGGDCPGLNAVIRAVIKTFLQNGCEVFGIYNGFNGLINGNLKQMDYADVSGILPRGGTILGTTNRDNPFKFAVEENGELVYYDMRDKVVENLQKHDIEALVVIGGDGSLNIGAKLARECGIKVVGVPKTIDNDLPCTERTFGFDTAMAMATEAVDRLHTTAESHHRVMALEVMGRYAGWIALHSGIAGGADVILIPEIPYNIDSVIEKIEQRKRNGKNFSIVVIAEGAKPIGGELSVARVVKGSFEPIRLGGAGEKLVREIEERTGIESRCTVLGYLQRGGSPTSYDRVLSTRYGVAAAEACLRGEYNVMVSLYHDQIVTVYIQKAASEPRLVPVDSEIIRTGRQIGICFGD
ncbi:MAG: 6-phosphofructokinase [Phascolarctobacterium sp.]|nr:6-phosphofructokinase [Phascolarctobacterium sp.]MBQ7759737.1 6-phosphofructokinase [Acidaminococcaceae bacterium]